MNPNEVKMMAPRGLKKMMDDNYDYLLIDVREAAEVAACAIPTHTHIPLGEIDRRVDEIPREKTVVVYCRSGRRSEMAVRFLQQEHGFEHLFNLTGGIMAYAQEVDLDMMASL